MNITPLKLQSTSTRLHGIVTQKAVYVHIRCHENLKYHVTSFFNFLHLDFPHFSIQIHYLLAKVKWGYHGMIFKFTE
jgi:hypothetical protein